MKIINQLLLILLFSTSVFAQKSINQYKYVIVPQKFDFVKKPDQYKTSSLTKFLFNKYGFTAFLEDEQFPQDLQNNRCLALVGNVVDASKMLLNLSYFNTSKSWLSILIWFQLKVYKIVFKS